MSFTEVRLAQCISAGLREHLSQIPAMEFGSVRF